MTISIKNINQFSNLRGLERESLRVLKDGTLSLTPHPISLGSKLKNNTFTVDFSEGHLEFISKPVKSIDKMIDNMKAIASFAAKNISSKEILLCSSMPLKVSEKEIKIADFGNSKEGALKRLYRQGLSTRYGKIMQIISGIHYNFSFCPKIIDEFCKNRKINKEDLYFSVIHNYFEFMWLIPYFFGASPICAKTSVKTKKDYLSSLNKDYYIGKYSTSLRLSEIGYKNLCEQNICVSYRNITQYTKDIQSLTRKPFEPFKKLGIYNGGYRQQINENILQTESEFYDNIRPKQSKKGKKNDFKSFLQEGINYLEVRLFDINPFCEIGINEESSYFIEVILVTCLMFSEKYSEKKISRGRYNLKKVIEQGRNPQLNLLNNKDHKTLLSNLGHYLLDKLEYVACEMGEKYHLSIKKQREVLECPEKTYSGMIVEKVRSIEYPDWIINQSNFMTSRLKNFKISSKKNDELNSDITNSILQDKYY